MKNLKAHNSLKAHIDILKSLSNENEILKHIIKKLKNENYKLTQNISNKNNKILIEDFINNRNNNNRNNNNNLQNNRNNSNNNNRNNNNNNYRNNNNQDYIENKYKNNMINFLNKYAVINNKTNLDKKTEVPKLLVILYKKNLHNH